MANIPAVAFRPDDMGRNPMEIVIVAFLVKLRVNIRLALGESLHEVFPRKAADKIFLIVFVDIRCPVVNQVVKTADVGEIEREKVVLLQQKIFVLGEVHIYDHRENFKNGIDNLEKFVV